MVEDNVPSAEKVTYSPEQLAIISRANALLNSSDAVSQPPVYTYRPKTVKEMLGSLVKKHIANPGPPVHAGEVAATETIETDIGLRSTGGWGDSVRLLRSVTKDLATGETTISTKIVALEVRNDKNSATDAGAWYETVTWSQDILEPISDPALIQRIQQELEAKEV
jgi:hypothetical protein